MKRYIKSAEIPYSSNADQIKAIENMDVELQEDISNLGALVQSYVEEEQFRTAARIMTMALNSIEAIIKEYE